MRLTYLGWSGFRIDRLDGSLLLIDPPAGVSIPTDRPQIILITHGHPEHLGGTRAILTGCGSAAITVCASPEICKYLSRKTRGCNVTFKAARADECLTLADGLEVGIFRWKHLPLLPPGGVGPALAHLLALASRPLLAARIISAGIFGPRPDPMLGFRIAGDGETVLAYGEGLHRLCTSADAALQARGCEGETLLAAVEPEDADHLPDLIRATKPGRVFLYEPHAKWRNAFRLPRADLGTLAASLQHYGIETRVCASNPRRLSSINT